ncbi:MAG: kelch repeat-containing protein [Planctomycetota bacterium]
MPNSARRLTPWSSRTGRVVCRLAALSLLALAPSAGAQVGWKMLRSSEPISTRARAGHTLAFRAGDGLLVFGGDATPTAELPDELWWTPTQGWRGRAEDPPPGRVGHAVAEDGAARDVTLFGGRAPSSASLDDTWRYDGTWRLLTPDRRPSARYEHAMAAAPGETVVLFGGRSGAVLGDTWSWDGATWSGVSPSTAPAARHGHAMAYDRARGVTVLFGGRDGAGILLGDTWEWNGSQWTRLSPPAGPSPRADHGMAFDEARGRVVLFGGATDVGPSTETWAWDGGQWVQATPVATPPATSGHAIAYDRNLQSVVVHGGTDGTWRYGDLWAWDGTDWQREALVSPERRASPAIDYDTRRQLLWLHGGTTGTYGGYAGLRDLWAWDGSTWAERVVDGPSPTVWSGHGAYDVARDRFVVVVGLATPETWEWDGSTWTSRSSPELGSVAFQSLVYHSGRGSVLAVQGGTSSAVREWTGSGWVSLPSSGPASMRFPPAVAYDSDRDRLVVLGTSLFEWDGTQWQTGAGAPFIYSPYYPYYGSSTNDKLVYDPDRRVLIAVVGLYLPYGGIQQTWEWDGTSWTQQPIGGPNAAAGYEIAYDPVDHSVLQVGGAPDPSGRHDSTLWSYTANAGQYTPLGVGCAGAGSVVPQLVPRVLPSVGGRLWLEMRTAPFPATGAWIFGLSDSVWGGVPLPLELSSIGAAGCHLWVSADAVVPFAAPFGRTQLFVPLTNPALAGAVLFHQAVLLQSAAGITTTGGWRAVIGC